MKGNLIFFGVVAAVLISVLWYTSRNTSTFGQGPVITRKIYTVPGSSLAQSITVLIDDQASIIIDGVWSRAQHDLDLIPPSHLAGLTQVKANTLKQEVAGNYYDHL